MKFAVGYQLREEDEEPFRSIVEEFQDHIAEVYFPWPGLPSGRSPLGGVSGAVDWRAQRQLEEALAFFKSRGIRLNLLLNASCYGGHGTSRYLVNLVRSVVGHLRETAGLDAVTTMSPSIAETVKRDFPGVDVRASVNMRLGTVKALEYVAGLFDSFCMQREFNRDLARLAELKAWCDAAGKRLHILANSGCLNFCSVQTYHDNLVAHESEVSETIGGATHPAAICWQHYRNAENRVSFLQNSWIRPEDIQRYEPYISEMKLATRMHSNPRMVIRAYCRGRFPGNLADLLEPGHGRLFAPHIIDNRRFPEDWFARTTGCDKRCHRCSYCAAVLQRVWTKVEEYGDEEPATPPSPLVRSILGARPMQPERT
jgi:collagenase-like PrtC family protease